MARGSEAKAARKQARKEARAKEAERILAGEGNVNEFDTFPTSSEPNIEDDSSSSDEEEEEEEENDNLNLIPEKTPEKKKKSKSSRAKKAALRAAAAKQSGGGDGCCPTPSSSSNGGGGIKTLPLIMLIMLTGTTVLPALLYMSDYIGAFIQKNHLMGNIGHRLGIGPTPKKRVLSFYEKHDPEKLGDVDSILSKYYGDYPKLVKRLERKYGDYGYFINWEQDEAPMTLALDQLWETRDVLATQFDLYAPALVKTGARNMRHNFGFLYKKGYGVWKKQVWPVLQPYLGVPDAKTARKQKMMDKKEAERRKKEARGQRGRSAEFRDDDEM